MSSLEKRFWAKVNKTDGCWEWTAALNDAGYGMIGLGGREEGIERAHRLSYIWHHGEIPVGMSVCHKCDNRKCVRPDHLFLGTDYDNHHDMRSKGRHSNPPKHFGADNYRVQNPPHGDKNPAAVLTAEDVRQIRCLLALGITGAWIADQFAVTRTAISAIKTGRSWRT